MISNDQLQKLQHSIMNMIFTHTRIIKIHIYMSNGVLENCTNATLQYSNTPRSIH